MKIGDFGIARVLNSTRSKYTCTLDMDTAQSSSGMYTYSNGPNRKLKSGYSEVYTATLSRRL